MPDHAIYWYGYTSEYLTYRQNGSDPITFNTNNVTIVTSAHPGGGNYMTAITWNKQVIANDRYLKMICKDQSQSVYNNYYWGTLANYVSGVATEAGYYQLNSNVPTTDTLYTYDLSGTNHVGRYPNITKNGGTGIVSALWLE